MRVWMGVVLNVGGAALVWQLAACGSSTKACAKTLTCVCHVDVECPASIRDDECARPSCADGTCAQAFEPEGTPCSGGVCNGAGECLPEGEGGKGGGTSCEPGETISCYDGPSGTEGVGTCVSGEATCKSDGSGYGQCEGQVVPDLENCALPEDEDCNGTAASCAGAHRSAVQFTTAGSYADLAVTADGSSYFVASVSEGYNVDGVSEGHTLSESFVVSPVFAKVDENGAFAWSTSHGDVANYQYANTAAAHPEGGAVVAGRFNGTLNFGTGAVTQMNGEDIYIVRLDASGQALWVRHVELDSYAWDLSVATTSDGSVFLLADFGVGVHYEDVDETAAGANDLLLLKLTADGTREFLVTYGTSVDEQAGHIDVRGGRGFFTASFSGSTSLGGHSLTSQGSTDLLVAEFSLQDGTISQAARFGGAGSDGMGRLAVLPSGTPVLATIVSDSSDFNGTSVVPSSQGDLALAKLALAGLVVDGIWSLPVGSTSGPDVAADNHGHLTVVSAFEQSVTIDGENVGAVGEDALVVKLDWSGGAPEVLWHQVNTGSGSQRPHRVDVTPGGDVVALGSFATEASLASGNILMEDTTVDTPRDYFVQRREP